MSETDEVRVKALEELVKGLHMALLSLSNIVQKHEEILTGDPVAAAFRRFQRDADKQMERG